MNKLLEKLKLYNWKLSSKEILDEYNVQKKEDIIDIQFVEINGEYFFRSEDMFAVLLAYGQTYIVQKSLIKIKEDKLSKHYE